MCSVTFELMYSDHLKKPWCILDGNLMPVTQKNLGGISFNVIMCIHYACYIKNHIQLTHDYYCYFLFFFSFILVKIALSFLSFVSFSSICNLEATCKPVNWIKLIFKGVLLCISVLVLATQILAL